MRPRTPTPRAIASVEAVIRSSSRADSVMGGSTQEESPEWMPASSMCSMIAPMKSSSPSYRASTSISMAASRKRSMSSGPRENSSSESWLARYSRSAGSSLMIAMPRPPSTKDGRTRTGYPTFSATAMTCSGVCAVSCAGAGQWAASRTLPNSSRSSARSMARGLVPRIGTPARSRSAASDSGV